MTVAELKKEEMGRIPFGFDDIARLFAEIDREIDRLKEESLCRMPVAQHLEIMKQAVLAEREACAKIAEYRQSDIDCDLYNIGKEIRARGEKE